MLGGNTEAHHCRLLITTWPGVCTFQTRLAVRGRLQVMARRMFFSIQLRMLPDIIQHLVYHCTLLQRLNAELVDSNPTESTACDSCPFTRTSERFSKLQLKLNGNYSSLRKILAPSLRDHNGSLRAVNFSNWACATLREDEFLRFGAFLLARCRHEADFGLGFLGFPDSRLFRWFPSFSTSWLVRWLLDF